MRKTLAASIVLVALALVPAVSRADVTSYLVNFHTVVFDRAPDEATQALWVTNLTEGFNTASDLAAAFLTSAEFLARGTGDSDFVAILYRALLNREPSPEEVQAWAGNLAGGMSRDQVRTAIAHSAEAVAVAEANGVTGVWSSLAYTNFYRRKAGLPRVTDNPDWGAGNVLHAIYLVKNDRISRSEDTANPWYTPEGKETAENSNLYVDSDINATFQDALDSWIRGPFEAVGLLDPLLTQVGYGEYREQIGTQVRMAAGTDVLRGLDYSQVPVAFPVFYPADGQILPHTLPRVGVFDPFTTCPDFTQPEADFGQPLILMTGTGGDVPNVTASSLLRGQEPMEHCVFDETNYVHPDPVVQRDGRAVLGLRDAIIIIPRQALTPGAAYTASVTSNGVTYTWTFTVDSALKVLN